MAVVPPPAPPCLCYGHHRGVDHDLSAIKGVGHIRAEGYGALAFLCAPTHRRSGAETPTLVREKRQEKIAARSRQITTRHVTHPSIGTLHEGHFYQ
jgi:hypothetical protein